VVVEEFNAVVDRQLGIWFSPLLFRRKCSTSIAVQNDSIGVICCRRTFARQHSGSDRPYGRTALSTRDADGMKDDAVGAALRRTHRQRGLNDNSVDLLIVARPMTRGQPPSPTGAGHRYASPARAQVSDAFRSRRRSQVPTSAARCARRDGCRRISGAHFLSSRRVVALVKCPLSARNIGAHCCDVVRLRRDRLPDTDTEV
jgi:hypothetical protein